MRYEIPPQLLPKFDFLSQATPSSHTERFKISSLYGFAHSKLFEKIFRTVLLQKNRAGTAKSPYVSGTRFPTVLTANRNLDTLL